MTLREALEEALKAHYARESVSSVRGMMTALEQREGTKKAAAASAGIPRSTWGFWDAGKRRPSGRNLSRLRDAYDRLVHRPMVRAAIDRLGLPRVIAIHAVVITDPQGSAHTNATAARTLNAGGAGRGRGLSPARMSAMVDAWLRGDDPTVHLMEALNQSYGGGRSGSRFAGDAFAFGPPVTVTIDPPGVTPQR